LLQEHSGDELYLGVLPTFRQEFCELLLSIGAGDTSCQVALIQASAGDLMGYRAACRVGLERFASADDPVLRDRFVWAATLAPDGLASYIELVAMARTVATEASGHVPVCIGAALYRSGQFEEAAARLRDALANPGPGVAPAYALFFLAMVEYQQGHREAACEILQQATAEAATGPTEVPWNRRWTLRLLEREAAQLIVGDA
jgi:tetratricopeptide (TPR) repeat protein